jgi:hypothetical protein
MVDVFDLLEEAKRLDEEGSWTLHSLRPNFLSSSCPLVVAAVLGRHAKRADEVGEIAKEEWGTTRLATGVGWFAWDGWCQSSWTVGLNEFIYLFFNACAGKKVDREEGIFGRQNPLKGHVQRTWPTFRPNKRVTRRKVNFATRWQVRKGHLTILVY